MTPDDLRRRREKLDLTQAQLAALLGCTVRHVKMMERGVMHDGRPYPIRPVVALALDALDDQARRGILIVPADVPRD